jgi:NTE family protein
MSSPPDRDGNRRATAGGVGLALGGGSARGLAHILMLEAFDELGIRPAAIVGTSIGAIMGSIYAAGLTAAELRAFAEELFCSRSEVLRRLAASLDGLPHLWSPRAPTVIDAVTLLELLLPPAVRSDFGSLKVPFKVVATDFHGMSEVLIDQGPVIPAVAASAALPTMMRPVPWQGRLLIDGGFVNPTPFDALPAGLALRVAVDVTGRTRPAADGEPPTAGELWLGATQTLFRSLVREKLARAPPDILIAPDVGRYATMDFLRFRDIFAAAAPAKDEFKRALEAELGQNGAGREGGADTAASIRL